MFFFNFPLSRGKCVGFSYPAGKMFYVLHCRGQQHWRGLHMRTFFFLLGYVTLNANVTGILIIMLLKKEKRILQNDTLASAKRLSEI